VAAPPAVWIELTDHSGTPREQASRLITLLFGAELAPQIDLEFGEIVAAARGQLQAATLEAQEAAIRAWYTAEPPPLPPRTPPVLVAAGSDDVVIPPENMAALAARWPNARLELFEGGGHAFMAQEPQRLAALIAEFAGSG
jgi:pimeloyl-ACP methyl ester carboxylesterase